MLIERLANRASPALIKGLTDPGFTRAHQRICRPGLRPCASKGLLTRASPALIKGFADQCFARAHQSIFNHLATRASPALIKGFVDPGFAQAHQRICGPGLRPRSSTNLPTQASPVFITGSGDPVFARAGAVEPKARPLATSRSDKQRAATGGYSAVEPESTPQ